jgi:hypothetical protein
MAGRLAPASEVAGGHKYHTILKRAWSANFKMVKYVLLRLLRPELDGRPSSANFSYSCTKLGRIFLHQLSSHLESHLN